MRHAVLSPELLEPSGDRLTPPFEGDLIEAGPVTHSHDEHDGVLTRITA